MNKELLAHAQEEYLRNLNEYLTEHKKKPVPIDIDIEEIILKYVKEHLK